MRRRSTWFLVLLLSASLLQGCAATGVRTSISVDDLLPSNAYRAVLSYVAFGGE